MKFQLDFHRKDNGVHLMEVTKYNASRVLINVQLYCAIMNL